MADKKVSPKAPAAKGDSAKKQPAARVTKQVKSVKNVRNVRSVRNVQNVQ